MRATRSSRFRLKEPVKRRAKTACVDFIMSRNYGIFGDGSSCFSTEVDYQESIGVFINSKKDTPREVTSKYLIEDSNTARSIFLLANS